MATNTGTAALHLALETIGYYGERKVVIPPLCFRAVYNAVRMAGREPIYAEREGHHDVVIDVMNYGFPCGEGGDILDASEALGGEIPSGYRYCTLSFNWNKPITCGSGGMVLCQEERDEKYIRKLANQCKEDSTYFIHATETGYNYRMNDIQATTGMESLADWPKNHVLKQYIFQRYVEADLPVTKPPKDFCWNHWITLLRTPKREKVLQAFRENDIETRAMFTPHTREFPEINKFADETMCLPSSPGLTEEEQAKVIQTIRSVL